MDIIEYSINEVNKFKIDSGPVQAIHYDLHPHNLLFRGDQISAIIDYDSILYMPIGYAIAFSSLKLCRQHLALYKQNDSKKIGEKFKQQIHNNLLINTNWIDFFYELSLSEVLRRISIIINLNFQKKTIWNNVLPVQIAHLKEAELLFKN
jgi:thiamine kinase-like enzyme